MKLVITLLITIVMLYTATSCSLTKDAGVANWRTGGVLPPLAGKGEALGVAGPLAGVVHNLLLVGGGANFPGSMPWQGGKKKYYAEVYVFRKDNKGGFLPYKKAKLPFPLAYTANVTTPGGIICAGGENDGGISQKVLRLRWHSGGDSLAVSYLPDLPLPLTNAAITAIGNTLYLAGGETATGVSQGFYSLNLDHGGAGWVSLPDLPKPVSHAVMVAQSRGDHPRIYVIGGRKRNAGGVSDLYSSVFEYDPVKARWNPKRPLPYALSAGTGLALGAHEIVLFGGDRGETFHKTEELIAALANEGDEQRKAELNEAKSALQSGHPGFSREVLRYHTVEDTWRSGGTIPFETPVTTTAVKWGTEAVIPSGEIRAGVRTPRILAGRLKHKL
jgi:N-acetylneuraminate epimerase